MLGNGEVIAIDQDPLGAQGRRVKRLGDAEVWMKPLVNGDRAVAALNRGSARRQIVVEPSELGLMAGVLTVRDMWARADVGSTAELAADVTPRSARLYRASPSPR
jgi:alpha-galactosidase